MKTAFAPTLRVLAPSLLFAIALVTNGITPAPARGGQWVANSVVVPPAADMTRTLSALAAQYQASPRARRAALLATMRDVAATRQQMLAALIEDDPGEVLRVALPAPVRASLPAEIKALVEELVEREGILEVLVEDSDWGHRYHHFLRTAGQRLSLHFAGEAPELLTGSRVRVRGVRVGEALALDGGSGSVEALAVALPNTFGEQRTIVILVNFQDQPTEPYTAAYARDVVFNTTSNFDWEASYQQTWLTGDVYGWYTIPLNSTVCDTSKIASYAKSAAQAGGADLSRYRRFIYGFPANACSWWGYGTVGGNPSSAWVKGSFQLRVVGHEMGHNFGLYHARSRDCGANVLGGTCTTSEYGDTLDIMGGAAGHFSAFQKERLGWLSYGTSPPITTVQSAGTYWLDPFQSLGSNPKALKILHSTDPTTGAKTWYYVEYRRALGFDSFLSSNSNVLSGVVVHLGSESSGRSIDLLDMTPETASWSDPALVVGRSYSDPAAGVTIAPVSAGSGGASVQVSFGSQTCVPANPTVSLSPSQSQWVKAGTTVSYTVSVTNNDSSGCSAATFDLSSSVPAGWTASLASTQLTIAPGAGGSTTLQATSPSSAADGFYDVTARAADVSGAAYAGSATATYVVASSLNVAVTTDRASYTRKQTASITAAVSSGEAAVSGASVSFTITKPAGLVSSQNATTGSNGTATVQFRPRRQDPSGVYRVRADANANGVTGSAETSFVVQ